MKHIEFDFSNSHSLSRIPPSPPSYSMAPMLSSMPMSPASPQQMSSQMSSYSIPPPSIPYSHGASSVMMGSQTPFLSALDPPVPPVSSSAYTLSAPTIDKSQYEISPEVSRWDRQEPEYKHVDEAEAVVAPDVIVADTVDENSTSSDKVEKVHDNERLARMDLKYEEPEVSVFKISFSENSSLNLLVFSFSQHHSRTEQSLSMRGLFGNYELLYYFLCVLLQLQINAS